ncbi:MAG TPA: hypothetical protein DEB39_15305 [Planctomycetaceae bacterium]|nr:hypothetical protein [Planctomycetaceae bacterium]
MDSSFIYMSCQIGAESALKREIARISGFRPAFSRPGFLTFKTDRTNEIDPQELADFHNNLVFARSIGLSLGKIEAPDLETVAEKVFAGYIDGPLFKEKRHLRFHVWQRDAYQPGEHGFEPGMGESARKLHGRLVAHILERAASHIDQPNRWACGIDLPELPAQLSDTIVDCIGIDRDTWWIGTRMPCRLDAMSQWPGGITPLLLPFDAVSRAWLKFEEGLRWSAFPIGIGTRCLDIGSAPGGSSQALLARGAEVIGLDPGEMAPAVLNHPNFTHLRGRTGKVKVRAFRKVRWILADMNVAPQYTLRALEDLVLHPEMKIRGLLFTLKLFHWNLAEALPEYLKTIRHWGFHSIRAKQLAFNKQEVMVAAAK